MQRKNLKIYLSLLTIFLSLSFIGCSAYTPKDSSSKDNTSTSDTISKSDSNSQTSESKDEIKVNESQKSNDLKIHFIDTGNSDAILIQGDKTLLIDGGENNDENLIANYIKKQNIDTLDYVVATHPHADHIGGLDKVIDNFTVSTLLVANGDSDSTTYKDFINSASKKGLSPSVPLESAVFQLSNSASFKVFNTNGGSNANDQSLIILLENGNDKLLFTGDAEKEAELETLDKLSDVDLLKVGHHGSKTSTSTELLNKVKPEYAVITVGEENKYNHPNKTTMDKLKERNIIVHRTDECGNIIFTSTGKGLKTDCTKASYNFRDTEEKKEASSSKKPSTSPKPTPVTPNKPKPEETTKPKAQMVWLSATGSKYHSKNNCGRMNPSTARQVDLNTLSGYEACSKCF
ncbi:MAG: ComEC/Rec2 family competence protein [Clostridium sp.]|uniref:ComEC/Rec2 family competence protein n=1 Tax=Clostridium sp. TaxID=1506 RepID=UPI003F2E2044